MQTVAHCSKESQRLLQNVSSGENKKVILAAIRMCLWSLVIDETTDVSLSEAHAIVAQFYSA